MVQLCKRIAESTWFQNFIIATILLAGVIVGIQTYEKQVSHLSSLLNALDWFIVFIFTVEVIVKITAEGNQPLNYFKDGWNVFDFIIVVGCYLGPIFGDHAVFLPVLRLLRVLRVFKLVTALPKLQLVVGTLLKSLPSMSYVGVLLLLLFYIYGVMAVFLFGENDPMGFGNLHVSMLSLCGVITTEGWVDVMYVNVYGCASYGYEGMEELCTNSQGSPIVAALFFISFVLVGSMVILNLFVGVIMTSMDEMRAENDLNRRLELKEANTVGMATEIHLLVDKIDSLKDELQTLANLYQREKNQGT